MKDLNHSAMRFIILFSFVFALSLLHHPVNAQWSNDPMINQQVSNMSGDQTQCYVSTHPSGITFISWFSAEGGGNYYPRIQLYDIEGYRHLAEEGLLVSNHPSMTWITDYDMKVSSDGCCIIAFQDTRNGSNDPFIYKINQDGGFLWGFDGIELSNDAHFDANPILLPTNDGGSYVAWPKSVDNGDSKVMVQRITNDGQKAWTTNLELGESGFDYAWPQIVTDGDDGFILTWYKEWGPYWAPNRDIMAQKFDTDGNPVWNTPAQLFTGSYIPSYIHQIAKADGAGGVWVCWFQEQANFSTFVQHVDEAGSVAFPLSGLDVCLNYATLHLEPAICVNETTHDVFVFYRETTPNQGQIGLSGQCIDVTGNRLWGDNGINYIPIGSENPILINLTQLGSGGVASYIYDAAAGVNGEVFALRFDDSGNEVWATSPLPVSTVPSSKGKLHAGAYENGQMVVAWADERTGSNDIFAQNVTEEGTLGPIDISYSITPDTLFFLTPQSLIDGIPFTISNTGSSPVNVLYIQPEGTPSGPYIFWYIDPDIPSYPVTLEPGEDLTETVRWIVTDEFPETIVLDTLEIHILNDTVNLIIAADSSYIVLYNPDPSASGFKVYPNPFQNAVTLEMNLPVSTDVVVRVYSAMMHPVTLITLPDQPSGIRKYTWNGRDNQGRELASGVYYIALETQTGTFFRKIIKIN
jgi:hypothetical protein